MTETVLDVPVLARLRAAARQHVGPFIDPVLLRRAPDALRDTNPAWLEHVVGHPVRSWRHLDNADLALVIAAAEADAEHLRSIREADVAAERDRMARRQAEAERKHAADRAAWEALAGALPVPVQVWHNWTARHLEGYEQGADHIVAMADLHAGRLHRGSGRPLCWTPSRARELRHVTPNTGDEARIPDCKACLSTARRLAARG